MKRYTILLALLVFGAAMSFAAPEKGSHAEVVKQQWNHTPKANF